jgi:hypothetical protein
MRTTEDAELLGKLKGGAQPTHGADVVELDGGLNFQNAGGASEQMHQKTDPKEGCEDSIEGARRQGGGAVRSKDEKAGEQRE